MKKYYLLPIMFVFLSLNSFILQGQEDFSYLAPKSPTVAALGKFIDFPVSLYTGQAEVNVPIYNLVVKDIQVPISLKYHTGGVRVEDIATSVGLNWSLIANGTVTRSVNGAYDGSIENDPSFLDEDLPVELDQTTYQKYVRSSQGLKNSEHDYYYFSAGTYSGKYVLDDIDGPGNKPVLFPAQDIVIQQTTGNTAPTIITPDGLIYYYGRGEYNHTTTECGEGGRSGSNRSIYNYTTWFLTKIESQTSDARVEFEYENKELKYEQNGVQAKFKNMICLKNDYTCTVKNEIYSSRLTAIESYVGDQKIERVEFKNGSRRADIDTDYILSEIVITNTLNDFSKRFKLNHKYLEGTTLRDVSDYDPENNENHRNIETLRLVLTGVQEIGNDGAILAPYSFEYYRNHGLPSRRSYSQDHWGYFNGASNSTLVPQMVYGHEVLEGADRKPDSTFAIQGALSKITYPTGGSKSFDYELNECVNCDFLDYASISTDQNILYDTYSIGDDDYASRDDQSQKVFEKLFEIDDIAGGIITLDLSTTSCFCSNSSSCEIDLKLYYLNEDGSINETLFKSKDHLWNYEKNEQRTGSDLYDFSVSVDHIFSPGKYKLQLTVNDSEWDSNQDGYFLKAQIMRPIEVSSSEYGYQTASGLRIKQMEIFDPVSDKTIEKDYTYEDGYLTNWLSYAKHNVYMSNSTPAITIMKVGRLFKEDYTYSSGATFGWNIMRTSNPVISNSTTKGGIVGYSKVTVSEVGNGYEENYFYSPKDHPDKNLISQDFSENIICELPPQESLFAYYPYSSVYDEVIDAKDWAYPFSLSDEKDWKRGLLKEKIIYREDGSPLKKIENKYNFYDDEDPNNESYDPSKIETVKGSRTNASFSYSGNFSVGYVDLSTDIGFIAVNFYTLESSWYDIDEVIETNYFDDGGELTSTTKYEYSSDQKSVKSISTTDSKGDLIKTTSSYPIDYETDIAKAMVDSNIIYQTLSEKKEVNGIKVLESQNTFDIKGEYINLTQTKVFPTGGSDFTTHDLTYNDQGNIIEVSKNSNENTVYLWGYNNTYPTAKVVNAEHDEVFAHSFDQDIELITYNGGVTSYDENIKYAGGRSLKTVNSGTDEDYYYLPVVETNLSQDTKFKYSVWVYSTGPSAQIFMFWNSVYTGSPNYSSGGHTNAATSTTNKWVLLEGEMTVPKEAKMIFVRVDNNSAGTVYFDDIRFHPTDAQMTTYTYKPLVGITSQTDPRGIATNYEYDEYGRLKLVRDNEGKIIQQYNYNYKNSLISISHDTIKIPYTGGTYSIAVNGDNWSYSSLPSWISGEKASSSLNFTVGTISCGEVRDTKITFTDENGSISTLQVVQEVYPTFLSNVIVYDDEYTAGDLLSYSFNHCGITSFRAYLIGIRNTGVSTTLYEITEGSQSLSNLSGSGGGDWDLKQCIYADYDENSTNCVGGAWSNYASYKVKIYGTANNLTFSSVSDEFTIRPRVIEEPDPLKTDVTALPNEQCVGYSGFQYAYFDIECDDDYTWNINYDEFIQGSGSGWCSYNPSYGTGPTTIKVTIGSNSEDEIREAVIPIYHYATSVSDPYKLYVIQRANGSEDCGQ